MNLEMKNNMRVSSNHLVSINPVKIRKGFFLRELDKLFLKLIWKNKRSKIFKIFLKMFLYYNILKHCKANSNKTVVLMQG